MSRSQAQTVPLTSFSFDQDLRVLQLEGKLPLENSMNLRPISFNKKFTPDSLYQIIGGKSKHSFKEAKIEFWKGHGKLALLPASSITKFTSHHPYGWSDGAFMASNGIQNITTLGFYGSLGPLSLQLKPEFLYFQDKSYETTTMFGPQIYRPNQVKIFPGQSRASINIASISLALSSENLTWGPGYNSTLMLSNNSPGFLHFSFNSLRPIKTKIGNIEFQLIGGKLIDEFYGADELNYLKIYNNRWGLANDKENVVKYINAINFVYSPSFLKGISLGVTRSYISSAGNVFGNLRKKIGFRKTYLPILDGFFKEKRLAFEDALAWNQLVSLYTTIRFPKYSSEIYMEYGWNDHKFNLRDLIMSPTHSAAFMVGVKKIVTITSDTKLDFSIEYLQLAQQIDNLTRDAGSWYIHFSGSTAAHFGQILGSGFGFGNNAFSTNVTLRKKFDQLGLVFNLVQNDPVLKKVKWTDYQIGLQGRKKVNDFLINLQLNQIFSNNYAWQDNANRFNFMGMMGVSYFF